MRLTEYLAEAAGQYGLVISREKASGKFEDIELYDIAADKIVGSREPSHVHNLFQGLIGVIREHGAWQDLEPFIAKNSRESKPMGPDWSDDENFVNTLYGPLDVDEIGRLTDEFEDMYRDDTPAFVDQEDR